MISARATTEQAMRGQIGQPVACMMENKVVSVRLCGESWRVAGGSARGGATPLNALHYVRCASHSRDRPAAVKAVEHGVFVHQNCGQLCGQLLATGPSSASLHAFRCFAEKSGSRFLIKINYLHERDGPMNAFDADSGRSGAAVEFLAHARLGDPHD
jgi:hypothetical protein